MEGTCRRMSTIAARIYAVLVFLFGLAFTLLGLIFAGAMHVSESAPQLLVPGVVFMALSVFIWPGALWAMSVAAAFSVAFVAFVLEGSPGVVAPLAVPAVFVLITAVTIVCRIKGRAAGA